MYVVRSNSERDVAIGRDIVYRRDGVAVLIDQEGGTFNLKHVYHSQQNKYCISNIIHPRCLLLSFGPTFTSLLI
jgi:hypothetical protein